MSVSGSDRAAGDNETSSHSRKAHRAWYFETILMVTERIKHDSDRAMIGQPACTRTPNVVDLVVTVIDKLTYLNRCDRYNKFYFMYEDQIGILLIDVSCHMHLHFLIKRSRKVPIRSLLNFPRWYMRIRSILNTILYRLPMQTIN